MENKKRLIYDDDIINELVELAHRRYGSQAGDAYIKAINVINDTPTVDAIEVVHGRWITDGLGDGERVCSVCKRYALYTHRDRYDQYLTAYCPNCGAKMDGGN